MWSLFYETQGGIDCRLQKKVARTHGDPHALMAIFRRRYEIESLPPPACTEMASNEKVRASILLALGQCAPTAPSGDAQAGENFKLKMNGRESGSSRIDYRNDNKRPAPSYEAEQWIALPRGWACLGLSQRRPAGRTDARGCRRRGPGLEPHEWRRPLSAAAMETGVIGGEGRRYRGNEPATVAPPEMYDGMLRLTQRSHFTFPRLRSMRLEGFGDGASMPRTDESATALICGRPWLGGFRGACDLAFAMGAVREFHDGNGWVHETPFG